MVSTLSVVIIVIDMILGVLIPGLCMLVFRKKYGARVKSFWIGCAVMIVFALVLEQIVHSVVLGSAAGSVIQNNIWLYALYGSLMAGLFEESGRFVAMHYLMKKEYDNDGNALMYGAGHGGLEMFVLMTIGMINNLVYSVMINAGQTEALLAPLDDATRGTLEAAFDALIQTPSWHFVLSPVERLAAITAQIGLSVIVWFAVKGTRSSRWLFALAILLHAILDGVAVVLAKSGLSLIAVEAVVWIIAIAIVIIARTVWKQQRRAE